MALHHLLIDYVRTEVEFVKLGECFVLKLQLVVTGNSEGRAIDSICMKVSQSKCLDNY